MDVLFGTLIGIREVRFHVDDEMIDRLSHKYSAGLLVAFAVLVSMRQYFGELIECWCEGKCAGNHDRYANIICWVSDTYYVAPDGFLPDKGDKREPKIIYYQWTPLILLMLAIMFTVPWALWKIVSRRAGVNIGVLTEIVQLAQRDQDPDVRTKSMRYATYMLSRFCDTQAKRLRGANTLSGLASNLAFCSRFSGSYLSATYLMVKLCYVANAVGQLFLLDAILGFPYHLFGVYAVRHFLFGDKLNESRHFPRVTMCDYYVRQMGNVNRHTVQCVLPMNMVNEKIFTILWFWFIFVGVMSTFSMIIWLGRFFSWPKVMTGSIKRQLLAVSVTRCTNESARAFTVNYLRRDGLLVFHLIGENAGDLISAELLLALWENEHRGHRKTSASETGLQDV